MKSAFDSNVFALLSRHLSRHDENYLTQCLAAAFNNSNAFRGELIATMKSADERAFGSLPTDGRGLWMDTQRSHENQDGLLRNILDAVILSGDRPLVAFEAKLLSAIRPEQLRKYIGALKRSRSKCPLVLLALAPDLSGVSAHVRRSVTGLSWLSVYQSAQRAAARPGKPSFERRILEAFMGFLETWGVVAPEPIDAAAMKRVCRLGAIASGSNQYQSVGRASWALNALATLASRLELHRDEEWKDLADDGWIPTSYLIRDPGDSTPFVSLIVGYRRSPTSAKKKRLSANSWFGFELQLVKNKTTKPPRLTIYTWRALKKKHPSHSNNSATTHSELPPQETRALFAEDFDAAHAILRPKMRAALKKLKTSAAWKDVH